MGTRGRYTYYCWRHRKRERAREEIRDIFLVLRLTSMLTKVPSPETGRRAAAFWRGNRYRRTRGRARGALTQLLHVELYCSTHTLRPQRQSQVALITHFAQPKIGAVS